MDPFYSDITPDDAIEIEQLAPLMYELRSARDKLLAEQETKLQEMRGSDGMSEQLEARIRNVLLGKA